jgi:outer membrane beta-barrel protein
VGFFTALGLLCTSPSSDAQENPQSSEKEDLNTPSPPADPQMEPLEHQILLFLKDPNVKVLNKKNSLEFAPYVGPFFGDVLPTSIFYGMRTSYHFSERFAFGVDGGFSGSGFDPFTLGTVTTEGNRDSYYVVGNIYYHVPLLSISFIGEKLIKSEIFLTGGAGAINTFEWEPAGNVGGGIKVYFHEYITLRIDIRNFLFMSITPGDPKQKLTSNAHMMFGLSFFLPTRVPNR